MNQKYKDLAARAFWTVLQALLGVLTAEALGVPMEYSIVFAGVLSALKSFVATKVGDPETVVFDQ